MKNSKKIIKIITINVIIFILLVTLIETFALLGRLYLSKNYLGWMYVSNQTIISKNLNNDCLRMKTHPILSHIHDHNNKCFIKDGYAEGSFVFYNDNKKENKKIILLGGSTTDGFYQNYANGDTYPLLLDKLLKSKNYKYDVINGGVGGYSSTQELLKLLIEVGELNMNTEIIISFNGINELWGYGKSNLYSDNSNSFIKDKYLNSPYLSSVLQSMYINQLWIKQNKKYSFNFLPNIQSLLNYVLQKKIHDNFIENDNNLSHQYRFNLNNIKRWEKNITLMNKIADIFGSTYYTFLQPTMGIKGIQSKPKRNSNDEKIFKTLDKNYIKELNNFYDKAKIICAKLDFCFDLSEIAPPTGNNYSDIRHHNANGNKIIADILFNTIINK